MYSFYIHSETPSKKNSVKFNSNTHRTYKTKHFQEWHKIAMVELMKQKRPSTPIQHCNITLTFIHGDYRRRDSDNGCSSIMDLLVDMGIIQDDNWKVVEKTTIINGYSKNKPTCLIQIEKL